MFGKDFITTATAQFVAVGAASAQLTSTLVAGKVYSLATSTGLWVKQGFGAQTAAIAAANVYVPAGGTVYLHGSNGTHVSVIQDTTGGNCSINLITEI